MSTRLAIPPETRVAQQTASDPRASAWVSANAGSGKTFVLSRRVVRLLLDGVDPSTILSLTFTKAAAANMANRVFEILGAWVSLDDAALAAQLADIDGVSPSPERLQVARRLFARAVETPGGLKIQTIHAFCERILHLFPFEANVSAAFEVLDDAAAAELLGQARHALLTSAATHPDGEDARALAAVEALAGQSGFESLMEEALGLRGWLRSRARGEDAIAAYRRALAAALGVGPGETTEEVDRAIAEDGLPPSEWPSIASALEGFAPSDRKQAGLLREAHATAGTERAARYARVFLTTQDTPRSSIVTQGAKARHPDLAERLAAELARVHGLSRRRKAIATLAGSVALIRLAEAVAHRYEAAKSLRGLLDFDDLVARTRTLLTRSDAAWVLYKLDRGIEHILVDEAQDTSREQWSILQAIAEEFVAGLTRNPRVRTVFAVGDAKQSIFSFQGADPRAFEDQRSHFGSRYAALSAADGASGGRWAFRDVRLNLSFRSAPEILEAVDTVFGHPPHFRGLSSDRTETGTIHASARPDAVGRVELWPLETPTETGETDAWDDPLDAPDPGSPAVRLARRIAERIDGWRREGDDAGRIVRPGDVLVLVRSRGPFFEAMIRALKQRDVPVAGADRLALTDHIAVRDLIALGQASLLPEDDLTLAAVLRSPLVGLTEDDLFAVAHGRDGSLAEALAGQARGDVRWRDVNDRLEHWRRLARRTGPFGFYAQVLGPSDGRRRIVARLGTEAADAVDEFLRLALDHEQRNAPSLALFLQAVDGADVMVRRDMEAGRDEVRVMTVHGAKGLEAPVVFLADTCTVPRNDARLLDLDAPGGPLPVWSRGATADPAAVLDARAGEQERIREEYHRLLYVGMTRAKDRLVVAGFVTSRGRGVDCWYDMVHSSLSPLCRTVPAEDGRGEVLRYERRPPEAPEPVADAPPPPPPVRPAWLDRALVIAADEPDPLRPSKALAAADSAPRATDAPFLREARAAGVLVHRLLELLPAIPIERRAGAARALAASRGAELAAARLDRLVADALALLEDPRLAALFGPDSRAEASLAGRLRIADGGYRRVSGQVDRLAITPDEVLVADYKTAARPPASPDEVPEAYVGQLAVYRALVGGLAPGRPVRCLLIYTSGPLLLEIPGERLDAALARITAA